jgi:GST-like protein
MRPAISGAARCGTAGGILGDPNGKNGVQDMARAKTRTKPAAKPKAGPKTRSKAAAKRTAAKRKPVKAKSAAKPRQRPIELYYWPTPNGWKISIMLEECGLPYVMKPVNISQGDQFRPDFLKISPNNRMPAIVDPDGPGGRPISVFESGAILQYLGRKTGRFYPADERARVEVDQWLMWQMGGLGPMAGQAHHFRLYAPEQVPYAIDRYTNECNRLYGVMNIRLRDRPFLAGRYSIADIACVGWASRYQRQGQDLTQFPHLKRWLDTVLARPAVQRGLHLRVEEASRVDMKDPKVQALLFAQRARAG